METEILHPRIQKFQNTTDVAAHPSSSGTFRSTYRCCVGFISASAPSRVARTASSKHAVESKAAGTRYETLLHTSEICCCCCLEYIIICIYQWQLFLPSFRSCLCRQQQKQQRSCEKVLSKNQHVYHGYDK